MIYFKHQSNMRHDLKIRRVIQRYGLEGYGLYNLIVESITESLTNDSPMPDLQENCEDIAILYNGNTSHINEIMNFMINQGLFELDELSGSVLCGKVYKFLDTSQTRSESLRQMIKSYKEQVKLLPVSTCSDIAIQSQTVSDIQGHFMTNLKETDTEEDIDIRNRYKEKSNKKEKPSPFLSASDPTYKIDSSINRWNSKDGLPKTRKLTINLGEKARDIIETVKLYSADEIHKAIDNYHEIFGNQDKYKPIAVYGDVFGFLKNGVEKYWDESMPFEAMKIEKGKSESEKIAEAFRKRDMELEEQEVI